MVGQSVGKIRKNLLSLKECKIALSQQDTVILDNNADDGNNKTEKEEKEKKEKAVDRTTNDEIKQPEIKDKQKEDNENGKKESELEKVDVNKVIDKEQKKENVENVASLLNSEGKDRDKMEEESGGHIEHMAGYVNNGETFDADADNVETPAGDVEVCKQKEEMTMDEMLFTEETKSEKEERMKVIGTSLAISQLENDLDVILTKKLRVSDTEERIERLKHVIGSLQGFTYSKKETDDKNFEKPHETVEAVQNVSDYGMKKEEERDMEIVQKSEEKDKVNSSTGTENIEENQKIKIMMMIILYKGKKMQICT